MNNSEFEPWDLVLAGRYQEALWAYDARGQKEHGETALDCANRATVLLCLGSLSEAFDGFARANELERQLLNGQTQPYLEKMSAVQWLLRQPDEAIRTIRSSVDGVTDGTICFTDNAGGVSQGLLLWYFGITQNDARVVRHARSYLGRLAKKSRGRMWPGPIAALMLGQLSQDGLLFDTFGITDMGKLMSQAKCDLLMRRKLVKALFYIAVQERANGNEMACRRQMFACCCIDNPILEVEWYLAQDEARRHGEKARVSNKE